MKDRNLEENQMDNMFTFDENEPVMKREKESFKRAKRKSTLKMISISIFVVVVVSVLGCVFKMQVTPSLLDGAIREKDSYFQIYGANSYLSMWEKSSRLMGSDATAIQYRLIEDVPVYERQISLKSDSSNIQINGGSDLDWQKNQYEDTYYLNGTKTMQFFAPELDYPAYANDFHMLKNMGGEKRAELAVSFDKDYTLDKIQKMLPEGVNLSWNWVKGLKDENTKQSLKYVYLGDQISGFPMNDKIGNPLGNPIVNFKDNLEIAMKAGGKDEGLYDQLEGEKLTASNLKISGIVVTGSAKDLVQLEGKSFVKAASLGATVDKY